jgi:hypothetical protein
VGEEGAGRRRKERLMSIVDQHQTS